MNFKPYEDVPLFLASSNGTEEYIFAERATLSVEQPTNPVRCLDDNVLSICSYGLGDSMNYMSQTFVADTPASVVLGPKGGPPLPLAPSIKKIPKDTKVTFPNNKVLYFSRDVIPSGHDYIVELYSKSSTSLTEEEAQQGYFEPIFDYAATGPIKGSLQVNFYIGENNLPSFFNITGISDPGQYPPIDEEKITGFLGDFTFEEAYLRSFQFSVSPNSISQASASFDLYGKIEKVDGISNGYFNCAEYSQQSIPHGSNSKLIGLNGVGIEHPTSFSYSINVDRQPRYECPTVDSASTVGLTPARVAKNSTTINMSVAGEGFDTDVIYSHERKEEAHLKIELRDLTYDSFEDNSNGLLSTFECRGLVTSQSVDVGSAGHLNGQISVGQLLK